MAVIVPGRAGGETDETLREQLRARESEVRQLRLGGKIPKGVLLVLQARESEARQLRRQLVIAQRTVARNEKLQALGQLIAGVAHEMANPLTAVVACASLIGTAKTLEDARRHAATIDEQGQRATQIVQTLSVFARGRRATRRPVSLNDVAHAVIDLRRDQLAAGRVEVIEALDPELPLVEGDPYELERVVQNLVSNAHDAMVNAHGRGHLTVRTCATGDTVRLAVVDDGPGIPRARLAHIFEAFFTTKGERGSGLGLAIARELVTNHQGSISVESRPGTGTSMTVALPRLPPAGSVSLTGGMAAEGRRAAATILIVDDEPEFGHFLTDLLGRRGYETHYVDSAAAALERLRDHEFDIILTDLRMPEMSGEDLWRELQRERPALARRTVFMTGHYATLETAAIVDAIEQPCLTKPFRTAELDELLASLERASS
jgi:two-component system NtrC family sensor kinase